MLHYSMNVLLVCESESLVRRQESERLDAPWPGGSVGWSFSLCPQRLWFDPRLAPLGGSHPCSSLTSFSPSSPSPHPSPLSSSLKSVKHYQVRIFLKDKSKKIQCNYIAAAGVRSSRGELYRQLP